MVNYVAICYVMTPKIPGVGVEKWRDAPLDTITLVPGPVMNKEVSSALDN